MTDGGSSIPEVHALLATLVASKPAGRFAETGTARWQCRSCQVLRAEVVHGHWLDVSLSRHRGSATELGLPAEQRRNHRPPRSASSGSWPPRRSPQRGKRLSRCPRTPTARQS